MDDSLRSADPATKPAARDARGSAQGAGRVGNLGLVARAALASAAPPSRARIAQRTELTRSTVSRLVDDLVAAGFLQEGVPSEPTRSGRPGTPLVAGTAIAALGLQVNVAGLAARVVDLSGQVVAERLVAQSLVDSDPAEVLAQLRGLALACLAEVPASLGIVGARLALPGVVSVPDGVLLVAPNLGWREVRPADHLGSGIFDGMPLRLGNEADLAARTIADMAPGRPGPLRDFVYVSGEIGIGGAVVLDGEVLTGNHGWAGEIGHVCVDPNGPRCRCGSTGCLERYVGRDAIAAAAGCDPLAVVDLVRAGDERALASTRAAARALGIALAGVVNLLDIPAIVLGGYLGQIGGVLIAGLEEHLAARVLSSGWVTPTVTVATERPAAGATGAAFAELNAVLSDPAPWVDGHGRGFSARN